MCGARRMNDGRRVPHTGGLITSDRFEKRRTPSRGRLEAPVLWDIFRPSGGVSGDGGCRSARADAPKGKR